MTTAERLQQHERSLARLEGERDRIEAEIVDCLEDLAAVRVETACNEQARDIINEVLLATQEEVVGLVSSLVSLALAAVYGPGHGFELDFQIARNQSEATPWIVRDGQRFSPREEVGGGVLDVAALALRIALWSLQTPRTAPVFILDEPGKWVSADLQEMFGGLLKELSTEMGIQFILVSHSEQIQAAADATFRVVLEEGISRVERV